MKLVNSSIELEKEYTQNGIINISSWDENKRKQLICFLDENQKLFYITKPVIKR